MLRGAALVSLTLFAVPTTADPPPPPPSPSPPSPVPFPPPLPPPPVSPGFKCTNTCGGNLQGPSRPRARDGECTDGGPGDTISYIYSTPICPLGEDCDDCGSRALPPDRHLQRHPHRHPHRHLGPPVRRAATSAEVSEAFPKQITAFARRRSWQGTKWTDIENAGARYARTIVGRFRMRVFWRR